MAFYRQYRQPKYLSMSVAMRMRWVVRFTTTALAMLLSGLSCGEPINEILVAASVDEGYSEVSFKVAIPTSVASSVVRVEYVITADDMLSMSGDLALGEGNIARGVVEAIPAGSNRQFTLQAYDVSGTRTHTGTSEANVVAGETVIVEVILRPSGGEGLAEIRGSIVNLPQAIVATDVPLSVQLTQFRIVSRDSVEFKARLMSTSEDGSFAVLSVLSETIVNDNLGNFFKLEHTTLRNIEVGPNGVFDFTILCRSDSRGAEIGNVFVISLWFGWNSSPGRFSSSRQSFLFTGVVE